MMRKKLIAAIGFLLMLFFASLTFAKDCPENNSCPINATTVAFLKAHGVTDTQLVMANKYIEDHAVKVTK